MENIKILALTVNTQYSNNLEIWKRSAERYGYNYKILGLGEKWRGWKWRTKKYIEALKFYNKIEIFILCDSDDLYFTGPRSEFLEKFLDFNSEIVIGTEEFCCTGNASRGEKKETTRKLYEILERKNINTNSFSINGGCLCGYREDLLKLLNKNKDAEDDQYGYISLYIKDQNLFTPDYYQKLLGTHLNRNIIEKPIDDWEIRKGRIYNKITKTYPLVMHFPGGRFNNYKRYLHEDDKNFEIKMKLKHKLIIFFKENIVIIMLLILIIIIIYIMVSRNTKSKKT